MKQEKNDTLSLQTYKDLTCYLLQEMTGERFIHQIYSIVCLEHRKEVREVNV